MICPPSKLLKYYLGQPEELRPTASNSAMPKGALGVTPLSLTQVAVPGPPVLPQALERGCVQLVWSL